MSFEDLYDCCFRNIGVIHLTKSTSKGDEEEQNELTTLDTVFASSRYVIFYLISSSCSRSLELVSPLKKFVQHRNENNSDNSKESPARLRRFFGGNKKSRKKRLVEVADVGVVIFDLDLNDDSQPQAVVNEAGWYMLVPIGIMAKSRLLRALHYYSTPALIVLDASNKQIITTDGRRLLQDDSDGSNFPWWNPAPEELFQGAVLRNCKEVDGTKKIVFEDFKNLSPTVKGLYFGANWCPPCRTFTKQLISCYESLKNAGIPFEIYFCSSDRSEKSFEQHFSTMPWLAFPFDQQKLTSLTRLYGVNGIPAFLILDEENSLITRHGRNAMMGDPSGKLFPWGPQPIYELNEHTLCRLRDEPSLVLFTEGSPDDVTFSMEVLRPTADSLFLGRRESIKRSSSKESNSNNMCTNINGNGDSSNLTYSTNSVNSSISSDVSIPPWADPLQIFYTGDDPLCDLVLEGLGLGNAELPLIVILDATVGRMCICEKPDVSCEIVADFVNSYKNGKLEMLPLPSICQNNNQPSQVGGIPMRAIQQALGIGSSPSNNSISNDNNISPTAAGNSTLVSI